MRLDYMRTPASCSTSPPDLARKVPHSKGAPLARFWEGGATCARVKYAYQPYAYRIGDFEKLPAATPLGGRVKTPKKNFKGENNIRNIQEANLWADIIKLATLPDIIAHI